MLTFVDFVVVHVRDQRAALSFYVDKLGFELRACAPGTLVAGYWLTVGFPGARTTIALAQASADQKPRRHEIMFRCDDLRQTYEELKAKGVDFTMHFGGGFEWVQFIDPDGNEFLLTSSDGHGIDERSLVRLKQGIPDA
jgi:lactoylglutathione lyase